MIRCVTDGQLSMHYFDDRNTTTVRGELSQDGGGTWEDDLALDYRRAASAERES